jgi:hypothetical protein
MKHEWRKEEKMVYLPGTRPEFIDVPEFQYIVLNGKGNPNSAFFSSCIEALYTLAYAIKMNLKKTHTPPKAYRDWTVYPLEGVWGLSEKAIAEYDGELDKDELVFDLMIRQPEFVEKGFFNEMVELSIKKKALPLLEKIELKKISDGECIQMLHIGSFDNEPASFARMEEFAQSLNWIRKSKIHREIYVSDFRKVPAEKMKTTLRFQVEKEMSI